MEKSQNRFIFSVKFGVKNIIIDMNKLPEEESISNNYSNCMLELKAKLGVDEEFKKLSNEAAEIITREIAGILKDLDANPPVQSGSFSIKKSFKFSSKEQNTYPAISSYQPGMMGISDYHNLFEMQEQVKIFSSLNDLLYKFGSGGMMGGNDVGGFGNLNPMKFWENNPMLEKTINGGTEATITADTTSCDDGGGNGTGGNLTPDSTGGGSGGGSGGGIQRIFVTRVQLPNGTFIYLKKRYYQNVTPQQVYGGQGTPGYQGNAVTKNGWYPATPLEYEQYEKNSHQFDSHVHGPSSSTGSSSAPSIKHEDVIEERIITSTGRGSYQIIYPLSSNITYSLTATRTDVTSTGVGASGIIQIYDAKTGNIIASQNSDKVSSKLTGIATVPLGAAITFRVVSKYAGTTVNYYVKLSVTSSIPASSSSGSTTTVPALSNMSLYGKEMPVKGVDYNDKGIILKKKK